MYLLVYWQAAAVLLLHLDVSSGLSIIMASNTATKISCTGTVIIAGAAGNVGRGILDAVVSSSSYSSGCQSRWSVVAIDPVMDKSLACTSKSDEGLLQRIQSKLEDVDDATFDSWFDNNNVEFIYTAEDGNRDNYAKHPSLGQENNARFANFARRLVRALRRVGPTNAARCATRLHITYVGGSWTRRQASDNGIVSDASPAKEGAGSNPYEVAKTNAQKNARNIAKELGLDITFVDYISVVPNFAPNFSVNKMVRSALQEGVIRYSPGDYGRPLLHAHQAGQVIAALIERQGQRTREGEGNRVMFSGGGSFETVLIPGCFVSFEKFATMAKDVVQTEKGRKEDVTLEEMSGDTPATLRARCISKYVETEMCPGFIPDTAMVEEGLRESARFVAMNRT